MIWDKLSPFYDFFEMIYNGKCFKGIAEEIKKYIGEEDIVLECGCGTGLLTVPMAQKCKKLVATDYSEGMLRQTKKKIAEFPNTMHMVNKEAQQKNTIKTPPLFRFSLII